MLGFEGRADPDAEKEVLRVSVGEEGFEKAMEETFGRLKKSTNSSGVFSSSIRISLSVELADQHETACCLWSLLG